jgi:hypothetical protein
MTYEPVKIIKQICCLSQPVVINEWFIKPLESVTNTLSTMVILIAEMLYRRVTG